MITDSEKLALARRQLIPPDVSTALVDLFKVLGDGTRLQLLAVLQAGELSVGELAATVGMTDSAVSHQLRTLRQAGVVRHRRDGKSIRYALDDHHILSLLEQARRHAEHFDPPPPEAGEPL
ncbi:MAG: winged helix-turn-helix transcriptional regulator [Candidatus Sericytochromatia bacterium]|nr:winged helix-turn-helix transcriptional regulator [Candidatus Tanganyikabacteria bacterium]